MEPMMKPYNSFFQNLIRGRQQEFLVYSKIYEISETLFDRVNLNIYDQVADVDGIDFLVRIETPSKILYLEAQVKKTKGSLPYVFSKNSLKELVDKSLAKDSILLVFAVNHDPKTEEVKVFFYEGKELADAHISLGKRTFGIHNLNNYLNRNTSIEALGSFLLGLIRRRS